MYFPIKIETEEPSKKISVEDFSTANDYSGKEVRVPSGFLTPLTHLKGILSTSIFYRFIRPMSSVCHQGSVILNKA